VGNGFQLVVDAVNIAEQDGRQYDRAKDTCGFVGHAHNADTPGSTLLRTKYGYVWINGCLQYGKSKPLCKQPDQKQCVTTLHSCGDKQDCAYSHCDKTQAHAFFKSGLLQYHRRGYGHDEVRNEKGERNKIGLKVVQLAGGLEKGYQCAVEPRDETEYKEQAT